MEATVRDVLARACLGGWLLGACTVQAAAADLFTDDVRDVLRTETISLEAFGGYVIGSSTENVYYGTGRARLSQLKWDIENAAVVGGRVAFKPLDWLTVRVRGWSSVEADAKIRDYDWLNGDDGSKSYTHVSIHPDTLTPQIWSGDVSLAAAYWEDPNLSLTTIAGFRHYAAKFVARGGAYVYSSGPKTLYDTVGSFPAGQAVGTYSQIWDVPYVGLGTAYAAGDWLFAGEIVASPFAQVYDTDNHILRSLQFKGKFPLATMVGLSSSLEYRMSDALSLVGRFEYQRFGEARGSSKVIDTSTGETGYQSKHSVGADSETALLSVGIKARL